MKKTVISVTEAARNFAECVNRAHYQNVTFVLVKNGSPVARLVPDHPEPEEEKACKGDELAETLRNVELPVGEAQAWRRDLLRARKALKTPHRRWR